MANNFCKCGCGKEIIIKKHHRWCGLPKYISGHNKSYLGKHHSEKTKQMIREKRKLQSFSEETRRKISKKLVGRILSEDWKNKISLKLTGEGNPMYGKPGTQGMLGHSHSEETKRKISRSVKKIKGTDKWKRTIGCKARQKLSNTLKALFTEGKIKSWNAGKTFMEDHRIHNLGGKSFEPYTVDFNKKFKQFIKERDGGCLLCNIAIEDLHLLKRQAIIHHIDYNKLNTFPQNCCILCNSCNSRVNFNRESWKLFFQDLLKRRYDYEYTEDQKIILDFTNVQD